MDNEIQTTDILIELLRQHGYATRNYNHYNGTKDVVAIIVTKPSYHCHFTVYVSCDNISMTVGGNTYDLAHPQALERILEYIDQHLPRTANTEEYCHWSKWATPPT